MTWSVYALVDPRDDQVRYVGKSTDVSARVKAHRRDRGATRKARWLQRLLREGHEPIVLVVETGDGDWQGAETKWIAHFRAEGYDLTDGTDGGEGLHNPGPETRALIAAAQAALWADPDVRTRRREQLYDNPEWRAKISAALVGKPKSPEHVAALPQNQVGYPWSPEVRAARRVTFAEHAMPAAHAMPRTQAQLDHLRAMSESNRGRPGWARGRVLSPEEREARGAPQRGRSKSPETRERMRQAALRRWARQREENHDGCTHGDQHTPHSAEPGR